MKCILPPASRPAMPVQPESLRNIPYFSGLSIAELESVAKLAFEKNAGRGELILLEGEPAEALYFVVFGAVKLFKTSSQGKEQTLSIVRPGESLNEVAVFDGGPNAASARAMGPVLLYGIRKPDIEMLLHSHPQIALNVIRILASRMRALVSLVEDLSFRHVISRVARILLEHATRHAGEGGRLTQQEMAAMAGTAREVVGRSLKELAEQGVITLDRHRIIIRNAEALRKIAEVPA